MELAVAGDYVPVNKASCTGFDEDGLTSKAGGVAVNFRFVFDS
jgi:hypothetical protein